MNHEGSSSEVKNKSISKKYMKKNGVIWGTVIVVAFILIFIFLGRPAMMDENEVRENSSAPTMIGEHGGNDTGGAIQSSDNLRDAPSFSFEDYNGNVVSSSDFVGQPLVVNSWAVWCPFCRKELPDFAVAQEEFGDQVTIIAIDRAESLRTARQYTDELGVSDKFIFLLDPGDTFYRSIGGFSMPETIFVNADGKVVHHKRGSMELNEIREKINDIL